MASDKAGTKTLECPVCGEEFKSIAYRTKNTKRPCCSRKCMWELKKTGRHEMCKQCGKSFYVSGHRLRRHNTYFCTNACRLRYQYDNNKSWEGFVQSSTEYRLLVDHIRKSEAVVAWKRYIFHRDKVCVECGKDYALHAHHNVTLIKIISDNEFDEDRILEDLRLVDVSNGVLLCGDCHAKKHLQSQR